MSTTTIPAGLADLAALPNWVNHDAAKAPYIPSLEGEPEYAKAAVPETWRSSDLALAAFDAGRFAGVGFQIHAGQGIWGGDLDHCRDAATGRMTPRARAIIMLANSYAEPSPSGTGAHFFVRGPLPTRMVADGRLGRKQGGHELYGGAHYLTMTLKPFPGFDALRTIDQLTADLLYGLMFPDDLAPAVEAQHRPTPVPIDLDDADLLAKACAWKGGEDFRRRHEGAQILANASDDDWAYFGSLRFVAQADPARMRRMALASGRVRDKWFTKRGAVDWLDYNIARIIEEDRAKPVYDPGRAGYGHVPSSPTADDCPALVIQLRADVARLGDELRDRDRTIVRLANEVARLTAGVAELGTENAALEAAIAHPDQAAGVGALDLVEEAQRSYTRGEVLTREGKDYARVTYCNAAARRSASTLSRGFVSLREAATIDAFTREEDYQLPNGRKKTVEIAYIHIPEERRGQRGKAVLAMLPTAGEKRHGGRRTITVPPEVAAQPNPVRREREHVSRFYDALTGSKLATEIVPLGKDFWTAQGEQLLPEEITAQRVARGYEPAGATTAHGAGATRQDDDKVIRFPSRQDADRGEPFEQAPLPVDVPGQCQDPDCGRPATDWGYCQEHYQEQRRRHAAAFDFAAGAD